MFCPVGSITRGLCLPAYQAHSYQRPRVFRPPVVTGKRFADSRPVLMEVEGRARQSEAHRRSKPSICPPSPLPNCVSTWPRCQPASAGMGFVRAWNPSSSLIRRSRVAIRPARVADLRRSDDAGPRGRTAYRRYRRVYRSNGGRQQNGGGNTRHGTLRSSWRTGHQPLAPNSRLISGCVANYVVPTMKSSASGPSPRS
jgi:hypothetical protein